MGQPAWVSKLMDQLEASYKFQDGQELSHSDVASILGRKHKAEVSTTISAMVEEGRADAYHAPRGGRVIKKRRPSLLSKPIRTKTDSEIGIPERRMGWMR